MINYFLSFLIIALLLIGYNGNAQMRVNGKVLDDHNNPIGLATVSVVGKNCMATTDDYGSYIITLPNEVKKGDIVTLRVSKSGYKIGTKHLPVSYQSTDINLKTEVRSKLISQTYKQSGQKSRRQILSPNHKTQGQYPNVTSYNQSGGITAGQVYLNLEQNAKIISSLELRIDADEITSPSKLTEKEMSMGIQSAVALFDSNGTRYRFVTDYQFSIQQISLNKRRVSLIYKPEDPNQILGRSISLLSKINIFAFNYSQTPEIFGIRDDQKTYLIRCNLYLNGIPINIFDNLIFPNGKIYQEQINIGVNEQFSKIEKMYSDNIASRIK